MSLDFDYLYGMKTFLCILLSTAFLCLSASCKKNSDTPEPEPEPGPEEKSILVDTISGVCKFWGAETITFSYVFSYDKDNRVNQLIYEGKLQIYGIGLTDGKYTFDVSYKDNTPEVTLTSVINWAYAEEDRPLDDAVEKLPLTFGNNGMISSIAGKDGWFYVADVALTYDSAGNLTTIRENDGAYYKTQVSHQWSTGNITSQTLAYLGYTGNVSYSIVRQFTYSNTPNNEFIDLNWLTGNLGLEFQNGITPLALIGLLGNRTANLIDGSTEDDGTEVTVSYEMNGDGNVKTISHNTLGTDYTFTLSYY